MNKSVPVLVVEDSHTIGLVITKQLQKLGFADIDVAQDGQAALASLQQKHYGLVLSDWEMQPMGGDEFIRTLRKDAKIGKTPVILITAKTGRGASWLAGADAYLSKPFTERDLETAIKRVLTSH
jgi:two-component system chemotaxis response regulator CheY